MNRTDVINYCVSNQCGYDLSEATTDWINYVAWLNSTTIDNLMEEYNNLCDI